MTQRIGALRDRFGFDSPTKAPDGAGGVEDGWNRQFSRWGELIYRRGSEVIEAARLQGSTIYKLRVRSDPETRKITADWRCIDLNRQETNGQGDYTAGAYNIREVDAASDRAWIFLMIENGTAI